MSYLPRLQGVFSEVAFSKDEVKRYGRHLIMPEVTLDGQKKLKAARVLCVGTGGLGSPLLAYLAAAGVGKLGIVDFDVVDASNLHRQIIHRSGSVGRPKVQSAVEAIRDINPYVQVQVFETSIRSDNALAMIKDYDVVVDGTDNFPTRYLINDACVLLDKPNVYGSIFRFDGQATVFWASRGPCYRCAYPEPPPPEMVPSCAEGGVLGVLPGVVGCIQATEVVKLAIGQGDLLAGRLLHFDALKMKFREFKLRKDPKCPICGESPVIKELVDYEQFCGGAAPVGWHNGHAEIEEATVQELKAAWDQKREFDLVDVREPHEFRIVALPGSTLIPMSQFSARVHELDSAREIFVICKNGQRSANACKLLHDAGFRKIKHVEGGLDAWTEEIDPELPIY